MTRAARALADLVAEKADKVALSEALADFDKRMDALDTIQELVEVELDGDELLADIEKTADFRDVCRKQLIENEAEGLRSFFDSSEILFQIRRMTQRCTR